MAKPNRTANNMRYVHELAFSIYFPLLVIMANAIRSALHPATNSWVYSLSLLIGGGQHARSYTDPTLRFSFAFLWAMSAIVLFLCLRALARVSFIQLILRIFAGIVALAGFPLTLWYIVFRSDLRVVGFPRALAYAFYFHSPHWLIVEVTSILVCAFLYASRKWPLAARWGLVPLVLHSIIWAWVVLLGAGSGNILLWPGYSLTPLTRAQPSLIYPLLGFVASLVWGLYVRQPTQDSWADAPSVGLRFES